MRSSTEVERHVGGGRGGRGRARSGLWTVAAACAAIAATACGASDPFRVLVGGNLGTDVDSIAVLPSTAVASEIGETVQFIATPFDAFGNEVDADVTWRSTDLTVATVDRMGVATAFAAGETRILALAGDAEGRAVLTVIPRLNPGPP